MYAKHNGTAQTFDECKQFILSRVMEKIKLE